MPRGMKTGTAIIERVREAFYGILSKEEELVLGFLRNGKNGFIWECYSRTPPKAASVDHS